MIPAPACFLPPFTFEIPLYHDLVLSCKNSRMNYFQRLLQNSRIPCEAVTPAEAGVQNALKRLDSGFRRNDAK